MVSSPYLRPRSLDPRLSLWVAAQVLLAALFALASPSAGQPPCAPLAPPTGTILEIQPSQADQLRGLVSSSSSGTTLLLHDGYYDLSGGDGSHRLSFNTPNVTLRSASGNREAVILDGAYGTNELVSIHASNVVIADLTLKRAYDHPIHISGPSGQPITGVTIHNVRITDPGQQAIKINPVSGGYADLGTIECSLIELTDTGRTQVRGCYTGGIDAHQAWGWAIRRNRIQGFWCAEGLSEHGVHFWSSSRGTIVEENVILDCARGIGFGLGSTGTSRDYPDNPYPGVDYVGHYDGVIRNNFITAADSRLFQSDSGFDTAIGLEQAHGTGIYHNSAVSTETPRSSSIEWRFENTLAEIANNLVSHTLRARDGAAASLTTNLAGASLDWFVEPTLGDLHLTSDAAGPIDNGTSLPSGIADGDIDLEPRDDPPDAGADEVTGLFFRDGFESASTDAWSQTFP